MQAQRTPRRVSVGKKGEAIYQSSSGRFEFPVRIEGKQRWIGCEDARNITEAREFIVKYKGLEPDERLVPSKLTFKELAELAFEANTIVGNAENSWATETLKTHQGNLRNYLAPLHNLKPASIDAKMICRLVINPMRAKGLSTGTIACAIQTMSITFNQGKHEKVCGNPIPNLRLRDKVGVDTEYEVRVVSIDEFGKILAAVKDGAVYSALHFRVCFGLWMLCGLRLGESLGLQWRDIDFEEGTIRVDRQIMPSGKVGPPKTKASKGRVDLPVILAAQLKELKREYPTIDPNAFVLVAPNGKTPGRTTAAQALTKACEDAGLKGDLPSPHHLRHSYGSALMSRCGTGGIDIAYVSKMMRHENVNITLQTYTHEWEKLQQAGRAGAVIDELFGAAFG